MTKETKKNVNYTEEQTTHMVEAYQAANTDAERAQVVKELAEHTEKTTRSIIAKLSKEGVYVSPTKKNKAGGEIVRKSDLVSRIAHAIGEDEELLGSLENATKVALLKILAFAEKSNA